MRRISFPILASTCLATLLAGWLLSPLGVPNHELAFRDGASYYDPVFRFLRQSWLDGQFPLWSPIENGGSNIAADATVGVFYPVKLVLLLPLPWPIPYHLYIVLHVLAAYWGVFHGIRRQGRTIAAATLAGISYAFCGHALSQIHNVPYLVSAAWLPQAWFAAAGLTTARWPRACCRLAVSLAAMVVGGDPHTAVNLILVWLCFVPLKLVPSPLRAVLPRRRRLRATGLRPTLRWLLAVSCAGGLAAPQIFPALVESPAAARAYYAQPRSLWESVESVSRGDSDWKHAVASLWRPPTAGSHADAIGDFSVGPWRWAETIWPNVGGRFAPTYSRWFDVIPAEGRCWSLSLYAGLLPLLLATAVARWRGGTTARRQATWLVTISIAASLGSYSIGWIINECHFALTGDPSSIIDSSAGGVYWFFTQCVPGYALYRYPAKWWTLAAFGASLLVAQGFDHRIRLEPTLRRRSLAVAGVSLAGLLGIWASAGFLRQLLTNARTDPYFGPLAAESAVHDMLLAMSHALVVAAATVWIISRRRPTVWWLVVLTAADVAIANRSLIPTVPRVSPKIATNLLPESGRLYRSPQRLELPPHTEDRSKPRSQLARWLAWDRATLYGKHAYALYAAESRRAQPARWVARVRGVVGPESPLLPVEIDILNRAVERHDNQFAEALLRQLKVVAWLAPERAPTDSFVSPWSKTSSDTSESIPQTQRVGSPLSPLWRVAPREVRLAPTYVGSNLPAYEAWLRWQVTQDEWTVNATASQWRRAIERVEAPEYQAGAGDDAHPQPNTLVCMSSANRLVVQFPADDTQLIVLPLRYNPGWRAVLSDRKRMPTCELPLFRVRGMLVGVVVPPGTTSFELAFRPVGLPSGIVASLAALTVLVGIVWLAGRSPAVRRTESG